MATTQSAVTQYITAANGIRYAYRRLGQSTNPDTIPLVLHIHFRANIDFWDPLFLNTLASQRPLIVFDQAGVGRSSGTVANTYAGWAEHVLALVAALKLSKIDLLGFSMGGCAVQMVALNRPGLVRKLVIAGSGPSVPAGPVEGIMWPRDVPPQRPLTLLASATTQEEVEKAIAVSFFPDSEYGRKAAEHYFHRIRQARAGQEPIFELLGAEGTENQAASYGDWSTPNPENSFERLGELKMPVLVLNGDDDLLIPTSRSFELLKRINNAQMILYPRAGHGFIWQYAEKVAKDVNAFLEGGEFEWVEVKL